MALRKYMFYNNRERSIPGGNSDQFAVAEYEAPEDCTIVSVFAEIALAHEALEPNLGYEHSLIAGWARLSIVRGGGQVPTFNRNPDSPNGAGIADWDAIPPTGGAGTQGTLNDDSVGDTWAITPFALSGSGTNTAPGHGNNMKIMLAPKTKRTLRRQDRLLLEIWYTNSGADQGVIGEVAVGTLFVQT